MAKGISPSTVVIAVNNTGRSLVLPPWMVQSSRSSFESNSWSFNPNSSRLRLRSELV